jgi:general secretion pathway protein H
MKAAAERPPTSPAGRADRTDEGGFTLIEVVCALAIIALVVAILLPEFPRGTSRARLEAYALQIASVLNADRNTAMRRRGTVVTEIDAPARAIRAGSSGALIRLPADVQFDATLAARCNQREAGSTIIFFPSGMSCGGVLALSRLGIGYQIRVNWFTGGVEVVPLNAL